MSHLRYYNYPRFGEVMKDDLYYSQAVRIGDRIEISGQGGWDPSKHPSEGMVHENFADEVEQAYANVDLALRHAGGKGWSQVYRVNAYVTEMNPEGMDAMVRSAKKWTPNHRPILTAVGVAQLGLPGMRIELEVVAHDEEGARTAEATSQTTN